MSITELNHKPYRLVPVLPHLLRERTNTQQALGTGTAQQELTLARVGAQPDTHSPPAPQRAELRWDSPSQTDSPHHQLWASQSSCASSSPPPAPGHAPCPSRAPGPCHVLGHGHAPGPGHALSPGTSPVPCPVASWQWRAHNPQCLQRCCKWKRAWSYMCCRRRDHNHLLVT